MEYKVSVIVPVYNGSEFILSACSNLINQTLKEIQIIFVNDGSTDDTAEILNEIEKQYDNVEAIHIKNQGVSVARNVGIENAAGRYVGFMDVDDTVDSDYYEFLYNIAIKENLDVVSMDEIGNTNSVTIINDQIKMLKLFCDFSIGISACYKIFKRSLYPGFSFPSGKRINEDAMSVYNAIMHSKRIACVNVKKYHYNQHEGSSSKQLCFSERYFDAIDIADQMSREIASNYPQLKMEAEKRKVRTYLRISKIYWMRKSPVDCRSRINEIRNYLKHIPLRDISIHFSKFDLIRYCMYRWCLPVFIMTVNTIDRR